MGRDRRGGLFSQLRRRNAATGARGGVRGTRSPPQSDGIRVKPEADLAAALVYERRKPISKQDSAPFSP